MRIDIFGIEISKRTRQETLDYLAGRIQDGKPTTVATVNPEFLMAARRNDVFRGHLESADLRTADGVGVLWAVTYLALPWRGVLWAWWQLLYSGASLIVAPRFNRRIISETVPGSWLAPALAERAQEKNWGVFLLGGGPGVAEDVAEKWRANWPSLTIETSPADPDDPLGAERVKSSAAKLVLLAYPAEDQLAWMNRHRPVIAGVAIGIGGTLDMIAGAAAVQSGLGTRARPTPPLLQDVGLGWLWRLVTQPWRWRRIANAVPLFMKNVLQYKSQMHVNN